MVNYKVTYYHDTCSAWVDKNPTIKHFEFEFESEFDFKFEAEFEF